MMKKALSTLLLVMSSATLITVSAVPTAMAAPDCNDKYFTILGINPWYYKLLDSKKDCTIKSPGDTPEKQRKFFGRVILNVIDAMLRLVAILTVGFVIFGGFKYMTSAGSPDAAAKGRKTITNALIGMVIATASVALVNFIGGALGL